MGFTHFGLWSLWVTVQNHIFLLRLAWTLFGPESVWAKVLLIVMSVICVCHTSSHLRTHTFTSSHITSSYLHLHILTPSHSHSHIFTSSQTQIFFFLSLTLTSSHLHIFTHIFKLTLSHLPSLTSSHTDICFFFLSHSHLHIFSFSPLFPLSFLSLLSLSLFSLSPSLSSLFRPRVVPARSHETSTLSHEMRVDAQKPRYDCDFTCAGLVQENLSHEIRVDAQTLR